MALPPSLDYLQARFWGDEDGRRALETFVNAGLTITDTVFIKPGSTPTEGQVLTYDAATGTALPVTLTTGVSGFTLGGTVGTEPTAAGDDGVAIGDNASAGQQYSVAIGWNSSSAGGQGVALGGAASAGGTQSAAVGYSASASGSYCVAVGLAAVADASDGVAVGRSANSSAASAIAIGYASAASNTDTVSLGRASVASAYGGTALGASSVADSASGWGTAVGTAADAGGGYAVALGNGADANGLLATALGAGANAAQDRSVAIGQNAATTAANQIMLGTATEEVYAPGTLHTAGRVTEAVATNATAGATPTVDAANGNVHDLTLDANATLTLTGAPASRATSLTLVVKQDATGSRTITWPASVKWNAGTAPTLSTAANAVDVVTLTTVDGGTVWYGFVAGQAMA